MSKIVTTALPAQFLAKTANSANDMGSAATQGAALPAAIAALGANPTAASTATQDASPTIATDSARPWRLLCWNVNGLRAVMKKGFPDFLHAQQADVICLQEIKVTEEEAPKLEIPYPYQYYNSAAKKGYSGTATFSRHQPINVERPFDGDDPALNDSHPHEGRVLTLEFADFFLVNVYVPNSQDGLRRLDYRTNSFDHDFRAYLKALGERKAVVVCGDFNVAHKEIDIARPGANRKSPGFTDEERASFSVHLESLPLLDVFRHHHGELPDQYTWWSYRGGARARNVGWRIDYFLVSQSASERALHSAILPDILGSDHCPILLQWVTKAPAQTDDAP